MKKKYEKNRYRDEFLMLGYYEKQETGKKNTEKKQL